MRAMLSAGRTRGQWCKKTRPRRPLVASPAMDLAPAAPLALAGFLPAWDIERRRVDLGPIIAWALEQLASLGHPVDDLAELHRHLDPAQALACARALTAASLDPVLRRLVHRAVRAVLDEVPAGLVHVQTYTHFRILVPGDTVAPFPPHTDFGFGHGLAERNLWFSLTAAAGDGALGLLPLRESLAWCSRSGQLRGVLDPAPALPPVPTEVGDVLLFTPLHLHRARAPAPGSCRVSVDVRLLPASMALDDLSFLPLRGDP